MAGRLLLPGGDLPGGRQGKAMGFEILGHGSTNSQAVASAELGRGRRAVGMPAEYYSKYVLAASEATPTTTILGTIISVK